MANKKCLIISNLIVFVALMLHVGRVFALDCPHSDTGSCAPNNYSCKTCHGGHAPGMALTKWIGNATVCMQCHTSGGDAGTKPFDSNDQATPGVSGTSHRWDADVNNSNYGASTPTNQEMSRRLDSGKIMCSTCHDQHSQKNTPFDPDAPTTPGSAGRHYMRINNDQGQLCHNCHSAWAPSNPLSAVRTWDGSYKSHPSGVTLNQNGMNYDRSVPLDADGASQPSDGISSNDLKVRDTGGGAMMVTCLSCHAPHYADSNSSTE